MIAESFQEWIDRESRNLKYGELTITLKFHDSRLVLIEKHKSEKDKVPDSKVTKSSW